ncbi:MAG TPA: heat-inducible transcriptional repressor HrcA [Fibrobacteria bacterium]|nr:heat-inducible transcriptional repressor HrcA [Fibrobacteria bacterium]
MIPKEPHTHTYPVLNERAQQLLKFVVERYIRDGQPVGSRTVSRDSPLDLSPATIRNVMCDLEDMGFIKSPHTSAGRIPTVQGYRLFVDSLLTVRALEEGEISSLRHQLAPVPDTKRILENASSLLSEVTAMAGVVMLPKRELIALRQVEFMALSGNRVLVILVMNDQEVQNRVINTSRAYTPSELQQASNYLNEHFAGKDLSDMRQGLFAEMEQARSDMNQLMLAAIEMANQAYKESSGDDYVLAGQTNLMGYAEMSSVERLRQLFEAFNHKRDILYLLDQSLHADGIQIFIGEESGYQPLDECSVVTAPYTVDGKVLGVLGVIGPTRMRYDRVIPLVDMTARLLGAALNQVR